MIEIPETYFESKLFEHVGFAKRQLNGNVLGCCPFCMEDSSWGKKKRFYYYADTKICKCFNCGKYCDQINFLKEMEDLPFVDLIKEIKDNGGEFMSPNRDWHVPAEFFKEPKGVELPEDSIDLLDGSQSEFYKGDYYVNKALDTIQERRLDTAKNRGSLFLSRNDFIHKNRIIIPFRDELQRLNFFQSRAQNSKHMDIGKYLSATNGKKTFYGIDKLDSSSKNVFVIEGPLDCFFVENSIGGGGIKFNNAQNNILESLEILYDVIYCLDNDFDNNDVVKVYMRYIKEGKKVFLWGGEFSKYKDFNEYAIAKEIDIIEPEEILKHTHSGSEASKILVGKLKALR
jgi:hypothetical protein